MASASLAVRVADIRPVTEALGPGRRFGLWVRGCSLRCPGCTSPSFQKPGDAASATSVDELFARILEVRSDSGIEGVSISGGEPFEQAESLAELARRCRDAGLSVLAWSGRLRHQLEAGLLSHSRELLASLDVLIDGPFVQSLAGDFPLRGSSNQVIHLLSDRYEMTDFNRQVIEFEIRDDGIGAIGVCDLNAYFGVIGAMMR